MIMRKRVRCAYREHVDREEGEQERRRCPTEKKVPVENSTKQ